MPQTSNTAIAVIGIDIGKNSFHVVGHDQRGAIVLRQKWSRGQVEARLANLPPCLIGMEACVVAPVRFQGSERERRFGRASAISGLPLIADMGTHAGFGRNGPKHEVAARQPAARGQEPRGR